ncbi:MAG: putative membrane protein [Saprospiraceae bacterium]
MHVYLRIYILMGRRLISFFITGLVLILPIGMTIYLIYTLVIEIDALLPLQYPGLGLLVVVGLVTLIGAIASLFVGQPIAKRIETLFIKVPLFGLIYKAFKDLAQAFVGKENKFSEPVLIQLSESEVYKVGFITSREAELILNPDKTKKDLIAVYIPLSYSVSGDLFFAPADRITPLNVSPKDAMQYAISGGIIRPKTSD